MAGLTKEQRAQRTAEQLAAQQASNNNPDPLEPLVVLVAMVTDSPAFPGAPITADVHPDEVDNWKAHGWKEME